MITFADVAVFVFGMLTCFAIDGTIWMPLFFMLGYIGAMLIPESD